MVVNGLILVKARCSITAFCQFGNCCLHFLYYTVCWSHTDVAEFGNESSLVLQARHLGDASE